MKKQFTLAFIAASLCASANAADIAKVPTNEKERAAYIEDAFQKIDVNRDGKIDKAEWSTFMQSFTKSQDNAFNQAFTAADADRDGKLSKTEAAKANAGLAEHFDTFDKNKDGFLTADEIRNVLADIHQRLSRK